MKSGYVCGVLRHLQTDDYSCGPTALITVLRSLGDTTAERKVRRLCRLSEDGCFDFDVVRAARKLGFVARYRKRSIGVIREEISKGYPIFATRKDLVGHEHGHFTVLVGFTDKNVITADPAECTKVRIPINRVRSLVGRWLVCIRPRE